MTATMGRATDARNEVVLAVDPAWRGFCRVGGYAALIGLALAVLEMLITFLPGGAVEGLDTIQDWFAFFQENPWMGLRTMGLVNFGLISAGVVLMVALYGVLRKTSEGWMLLAAVLSFMSAGMFFATNRAFPMLVLSNEYALATTDAQRAVLEAAGTTMVATGMSHTPGTFMVYVLGSLAAIIVGFVMLRTSLFTRLTAWTAIIAFTCLLIFEMAASLFPTLFQPLILFAMVGGILSMVYQGLVGVRLLRLARRAYPLHLPG